MFLRVFKHLLPSGLAFSIIISKPLRWFFEGLSNALGPPVKLFYDLIWTDLNPHSTRELAKWETQFGLRDTGITEEQRIERVCSAWKMRGGQDPTYLQQTMQDQGFNVFIHEWWLPGTEAEVGVKYCATPINPLLHLRNSSGVSSGVDCGEPLAECGEDFAECGNSLQPIGYPLVNKILQSEGDVSSLCGEPLAECGEEAAECGYFSQYKEGFQEYTIPDDPTKWPYFLYIGGEVFGDAATVESKRKDEFETLCLKICPAQQWLGIIVNYS